MQNQLIEWYQQNKRDLPWRNTNDPYFIWLSEIILQQTRVDQGLPYFNKFVSHYPTIFDLANANEQAILKDWQGLGYYSRARNLHHTAKFITHELDGIFPTNYVDLLKLKGIGTYTAAAIASFSYNLPYAVLDGNVFRVLSRLFDLETPINTPRAKKEFTTLANELIPKNQPAVFNQAIMEFGAMQCVPANPTCHNCVLNSNCLAFANQTVRERPRKNKKIKISNRYFNYLVFQDNKHYVLKKIVENDIWKNMYEFPKIETPDGENQAEIEQELKKLSLNVTKIITFKKHILSHQHLYSKFYLIKTISKKLPTNFGQLTSIDKSELHNYPIPKLIDKFLETYEPEFDY